MINSRRLGFMLAAGIDKAAADFERELAGSHRP